jgi:vancomycin resistance protein YoaR
MAAKHISGSIVQPGEVFSTNAAIGPRDAAAGWKEAKMFVSGQVVSGTGSGICQAASTLYNLVLMADLPVVERHPHSMRVMYVPPSRDAALLWGAKDFKFRNTTDSPLLVQTFVSGGKFHARLWSAKPRASAPVSIVSRVISTDGGTRSEAYKIVGGKRVKLSRDFYLPHP